MTKLLILAGLLCLGALNFLSVGAQAAESAAPVGRWLTQSGNFEIDIASCGAALCGTVGRVLGNQAMSQSGVESKPMDARNAMGMKILSELAASSDGEWQGRIYNRENGKTYDCRVRLLTPDQLELRSYIVLPLFGKTQVWTRVAAQKS